MAEFIRSRKATSVRDIANEFGITVHQAKHDVTVISTHYPLYELEHDEFPHIGHVGRGGNHMNYYAMLP